MRTIHSLVVIWLVVGAGLTNPIPRWHGQALATPGYPAPGAPATVTLLSPGAAPRAALRYSVPAAQRARMNMTMNMSMTLGMAGMAMPSMELPTMKMAVDVGVTSVASNGDITYDLAFSSVTAEPGAGTDPTAAAAMQGSLAGMAGIKGVAQMSNRGISKSVTLNLDSIADPTIRQSMAAMTNSLENLAMPLPEEAVGVGARWEVRQALSVGGATTFQKSEFEIVSIAGSTVTLKTKTEQTAPPQRVNNPAMPPEAEMRLEKLTGSGSGTVAIQLTSLVPTSDIQSMTSTVMVATIAGQSQSITVDAKMRIAIGPGK